MEESGWVPTMIGTFPGFGSAPPAWEFETALQRSSPELLFVRILQVVTMFSVACQDRKEDRDLRAKRESYRAVRGTNCVLESDLF